MINQNSSFENTQHPFFHAVKDLKIASLLRQAGIKKAQGASAFAVFFFLLKLVFQGDNLYRFLDSKYADTAFSKNTYYRFLNTSTYNWRKFLQLLSVRVVTAFNRLTRAC